MASTGTSTQVVTAAPAAAPAHLTLKLRGARRRRVHFAEEVVDNEELGRKKSKCCCQYHRPKAFDESSDEEADPFEVLRGPPFPEGDGPSYDCPGGQQPDAT